MTSETKRKLKLKIDKQHCVCNFCGKRFTCEAELVLHMGYHTVEKPYTCDVCRERFSDKCEMELYKKGPILCTVCEALGEKPFACDFCNKKFSKKGTLNKHVKIHTAEKLYKCLFCDKAFRDKYNLNTHMKNHIREKPLACPYCDKDYTTNYDLKTHIRTMHTGEESIAHELSQEVYLKKSELKVSMMKHMGIKPYSCSFCKKEFSVSYELTKHMRIHTGEKPYSCKICGKLYAKRSGLNVHMKKHSELSFVCTSCRNIYMTVDELVQHMKKHEPPFICTFCGETFVKRYNLNRHIRKRNCKKTEKHGAHAQRSVSDCLLNSFSPKSEPVCWICRTNNSKEWYNVNLGFGGISFCEQCNQTSVQCILCLEIVQISCLRTHLGLHSGELCFPQ